VDIGSGTTNNTIGGTASGAGNLISGNSGDGVLLGGGASGNLIEGNRIGTNAAGTAAVPNGQEGVELGNDTDNTVGGTAAGAGNVISGNGNYGVLLLSSNGDLIQDNDIGTQADGATALPNDNDGVFITSISLNTSVTPVAADNTVSRNTIAFNLGDGVLIGSDPGTSFTTPAGTGNTVTQNSIFSNSGTEGSPSHGEIGIDLGPDDGITANDSQPHAGIDNAFQDFPDITSVFVSSVTTATVNFTLAVTANVNYTVEFFVSPTADPSGFGQGQTFVGSTMVSSSTGGPAVPGQATLTGNFVGQFVTATATDASGNTSEFSRAVQVGAIG
jgi:hypothetical protein